MKVETEIKLLEITIVLMSIGIVSGLIFLVYRGLTNAN